ncbi:MAG: hypothetical protein V4636_12965 [Pseudomonadota bacterium]
MDPHWWMEAPVREDLRGFVGQTDDTVVLLLSGIPVTEMNRNELMGVLSELARVHTQCLMRPATGASGQAR